MIPASAASIAPRNDDSSQGYTTSVAAGWTFFARAINRSYLLCGASSGLTWEIAIGGSSDWRDGNSNDCLGGLSAFDLPCRRQGGRGCDVEEIPINTKQAIDPLQSLGNVAVKLAARAQHAFHKIERLQTDVWVGRQHRWNCRHRTFRIYQQHQILLTNQGFENRQRQLRHSPLIETNTPHHFKATLVSRASERPNVDQRSDHRLAQSSNGNARPQFGYTGL